MLYDKRWDKPEIKADPFSLESLIAWLETKPAEGTYDFNNCKGFCLLDQYADAMGIEDGIFRYSKLNNAFDCGTGDFKPLIAAREPFTFGAALERARKALVA